MNIWVCARFTALATCHEQKDEILQERYSFFNPFNVSNTVYEKKKARSVLGLLKFKGVHV